MIKWLTEILILLSVLLGLLTLLIRTPTGLNISLQIAKKVIPGEFNYSTASGIPAGSIAISNFSYRHKGLVIHIGKLKVKWQLFYLLRGALHITQLNAENIKIVLPFKKEEKKHYFPLNIRIHQCILKNLSTQYRAYKPVHFKKIILKDMEFNKTINVNIQAQITQPYSVIFYLQSKGTRNNYYFFLRVKSKDIDWLITGKGMKQWVKLQTHEAQTLTGHLNANVKLYFNPIFRWNIRVDIDHLNLRKLNKDWPQQLTLQLKTQGEYKTGKFPDFTLTGLLKTPKAYLHIVGQHHQQWNVTWIINVADFSSLLNTRKGALQSRGIIAASTAFPIIKGEIRGSNIVWPSYHIDKLEGHWRIDTSFNQASTLRFTAREVYTPFYQFSGVAINASGQPRAHHIKADLCVDNSQIGKTTIHLSLVGNLQNQIWRGAFHHLTIQSQKFDEWNIDRSSTLTITSDSATISPLCLSSKANYLCLQGHWNRIPVFTINSNLMINSDDASIAKLFLPDTIELHGRLVANFNVSNGTESLLVNSKLQLEVGSIELPQLHIFLTHVHASIDSRGFMINYRLEGYSQDQPIQVTGQTRLDSPGRPTTFTIQGENLLIVNTHQYIIYGSGELKINIVNRNIDITGTLTVHRAVLKSMTFSRAVTMSGDVVFIKTDEKETPWQTSVNIKIALGEQVILDALGIKGRLVGELILIKLPFQIIMCNGRITIVDGTFTIYGHALNIDPYSSLTFVHSPINDPLLNVRVTRTLKTSPIIPKIGGSTVTVGLDIEGTLHHSEVDLYSSDSNLAQANILSYLIFGHPADANTPDNLNLLIDAIDVLHIGGGKTSLGSVIDQITKGLGLTELGIESQTTAAVPTVPTGPTQSAFVVGRYVTPRIYIRYSRGIRTSINILQIRYLISKNWAIQTEVSSLRNGVDVLYSIERN